MLAHRHHSARWTVSISLAASLLFANLPLALAGPGDINSVNNGQIIQGGEYKNTAGNETLFTNTAGTGLHIRAGDVVSGREVDGAGAYTGNGGSLHFAAPGQVVRFDGNVDVNGIMMGGQMGNGGHVTVDAGFFYQNGNIFANGANGGIVTMNVGSMTMGPNAITEARGLSGAGGVVSINSPGVVNIGKGAIIDTSGKILGTYDTNVINIQGGLVNLDGILRANGGVAGNNGGIVNVVANGKTTAIDAVALNKATGIVTMPEANALVAMDSQLRSTMDGNVKISNTGAIEANGANGADAYNDGVNDIAATNGGEGGKIEIHAANRIDNDGVISVNGGNGGNGSVGGAIAVGPVIDAVDGAGKTVKQQTSIGQDAGHGGNAGSVLLFFKNDGISNNGKIAANGGNGGDGQQAEAVDPKAEAHYAIGGNGGNGGSGGYVEFHGKPSQSVLDNTSVSGGEGGKGGHASVPDGCACSGGGGACGGPGRIVIIPPKDTPPKTPPKTPPTTPLFPLYPKEYNRLGEGLPPRGGQVLSYNRSIFLARAPLPIIQKRKPPVTPPVTPPPPAPVKPKPKPKPPQRKATVRGYW